MDSQSIAKSLPPHRIDGAESKHNLTLLLALVENAAEAIFYRKHNGRYVFCNRAFAQLTALSEAELATADDERVWGHACSEKLIKAIEEVLRSGARRHFDIEREVDGQTQYLQFSLSPFCPAAGERFGVIGAIRDLTKKMEVSSKLFAQQNFLERVARGRPLEELLDELVREINTRIPGISASFMLLDRDGKRLRSLAVGTLPRSYTQLIDGVVIGPDVGSCGTAVYRGEKVFAADIASDPLWAKYRDLALSYGFHACWSMPIRARAFSEHPILGTFTIYSNQSGLPDQELEQLISEIEYLACIAIESNRAREDLIASEARFRSLIEHSHDSFFLHDETCRVLDVNTNACRSLGYSKEELVGMMPYEFDPNTSPESVEKVCKHLAAGNSMVFESHHRRKDGVVFPVEVRVSPFKFGDTFRAVATVLDISERKKTERELLKTTELLRAVINGTNDAVFVKDRQGKYLMFNEAAAKFVGKSIADVIGKDDTEVFDEASVQSVMERDRKIMNQGVVSTEEETLSINGVTRIYHATKGPYRDAEGSTIGIFGISRDITETKRLEEQFQQVQKMDAIGRLAGGIAHDFNNLLTVINSYSELLLRDIDKSHANFDSIRAIRDAGERAASLTSQLLTFSRKAVTAPQILDLNPVVENTARLLKRMIPEDIVLQVTIDSEPVLVHADLGHMQQVLMNLVVNARDAIERRGRIEMKVFRRCVEQPIDYRTFTLPVGSYAVLEVSDTGAGIPSELLDRIFEPFFTTKGPGRGTGLGLSVIHGIVSQCQGFIHVASEQPNGTQFTIFLPLRNQDACVPEVHLAKPRAHGSETILLTEDEDAVRDIARACLELYGYKVLEAGSGEQALRLLQNLHEPIDLLLTDLVMPGMSGRELAALAVALRPSLKLLYMSGHADELPLSSAEHDAHVPLLTKPFTPLGLAQRVRATLESL